MELSLAAHPVQLALGLLQATKMSVRLSPARKVLSDTWAHQVHASALSVILVPCHMLEASQWDARLAPRAVGSPNRARRFVRLFLVLNKATPGILAIVNVLLDTLAPYPMRMELCLDVQLESVRLTKSRTVTKLSQALSRV